MKIEHKLIEDFKIIKIGNVPDELVSDLTSALKEQKGWPKTCYQRCCDVIEKWLKIDDSQTMRESLFLEILLSGSCQSTISNHYTSLFLLPIKDFLNDSHRATIWANLSYLVAPSKNRTVYSFSNIIQVLVNDESLEYKIWKKSIINYCIKNEKSDFLSILYLIDKKIFKLEHLEKLIESEKLSLFYNNAFGIIKWPLKYNQKIENLIEKSLLNNEKNKECLTRTLGLIERYNEQENLGFKFLPLINALPPEKQVSFSNIIIKLLMNKLEHEMKIKSSKDKSKYKI